MKYLISFVIALSFWTNSVNAIVIRHDVSDDEYLKLGEEYSSSTAYIQGCTSTVIAHNWLLTAAHCVAGREKTLFSATHMNEKYRIESVVVHPKYNEKNDKVYDIALIQLKESIQGAKPAKLYSFDNEMGSPVVFVGRGRFGNGRDGLIRDDYMQRGATNTIIEVSDKIIGFKFDSLDEATRLEGISGPGDSGGPAFMSVDSQLYVAGVSSYQVGKWWKKEGLYGVKEYYTRVSAFYPWLKSVIDNAEVADTPPNHAIINTIKTNDREKLIKTIDNEVLMNNLVLNEAFYQSVILNRIELAKLLLRRGAQIKKVKIFNMSLFEFSLWSDRREYFDMLLNEVESDKGVHHKTSAVLPLLISSFSNDIHLLDKVKLAIKQGANINAKNISGNTALIIAGWNTNDLNLVEYLVSSGANMNISNNNGDTPLMDAAYLNKVEILRYLLMSGADIRLKNKNGKTALDLAKSQKHKRAEKLLTSYMNMKRVG